MFFENTLRTAQPAVLAALGAQGQLADEALGKKVAAACAAVEAAAQPRWVWRRFTLEEGLRLSGTGLALEGADIRRHMEGCFGCCLLAVSLGAQVDRTLSAAAVGEIDTAVMMDAAASELVEQYAGLAQALLARMAAEEGAYATGRFSPGYGDFPLAAQGAVLQALNAQRAIGLAVSGQNILTPRKSITAVMGLADHPVTGTLAGCDTCVLNGKCSRQSEGKRCGE